MATLLPRRPVTILFRVAIWLFLSQKPQIWLFLKAFGLRIFFWLFFGYFIIENLKFGFVLFVIFIVLETLHCEY